MTLSTLQQSFGKYKGKLVLHNLSPSVYNTIQYIYSALNVYNNVYSLQNKYK